MKETDGENLTKERIDELAGRCLLCNELVINGGGEEGIEWEECTSDHQDVLPIWDKEWGHTKPCPFFVTDLQHCYEHNETTTSGIGCGLCLEEYIEEQRALEKDRPNEEEGIYPASPNMKIEE